MGKNVVHLSCAHAISGACLEWALSHFYAIPSYKHLDYYVKLPEQDQETYLLVNRSLNINQLTNVKGYCNDCLKFLFLSGFMFSLGA